MTTQVVYNIYSCCTHIIWYSYAAAAAAAKSLQSCLTLCNPHRWQPTRLPCPWDSPGKNTAVGCHFLLQCMKVKSESEVAQSCPTLSNPMDCSLTGSSIHGIFQTRVLEWVAFAFSDSYANWYQKNEHRNVLKNLIFVLDSIMEFNAEFITKYFLRVLFIHSRTFFIYKAFYKLKFYYSYWFAYVKYLMMFNFVVFLRLPSIESIPEYAVMFLL